MTPLPRCLEKIAAMPRKLTKPEQEIIQLCYLPAVVWVDNGPSVDPDKLKAMMLMLNNVPPDMIDGLPWTSQVDCSQGWAAPKESPEAIDLLKLLLVTSIHTPALTRPRHIVHAALSCYCKPPTDPIYSTPLAYF